MKLEGECNLSRNIYLQISFKHLDLIAAGVVTDFFSEHKLFACVFQVEEKIASIDDDW